MMTGGLASTVLTGPLPWDEAVRLRALDSYLILDTPREADFDDVATLAAAAFGAPIGVVNLIADGRQWFKAEVGIGASELPLDVSICAHALLQSELMVVADTTTDPRFACNPLVTAEEGLRFYAGALLVTPDGLPLGTVCVLDRVARPQGITDLQRLTLGVLARQVMTQLELRRVLAQQRRNENELRESETRGRLALDAAELGAWEAVPGSGTVYGDARSHRLLGHDGDAPISFDDYLRHVHRDDRERFAAAVRRVVGGADDGRLDVEYRVDAHGASRWLRSRAQLIKLLGERQRLVGTVRDISGEKAAEDHRRLLNNELLHRVKNTLGVVQGIVSQSLKLAATPAEATAAIATRLGTLARAHDLLTQTSWTAAPLTSVIDGAVLAHLADRARVDAVGPDINLNARAALALSMALHELFTNAVKYGALSNEGGDIQLSWVIGDDVEGHRTFEMLWRERGGPPVATPMRRGFGSRLTGVSLAGDLGGGGRTEYAPDGVRWTLSTTLAAICDDPEFPRAGM